MIPPAVDCPCAACEALRAEAGPNFTWLRHKLLIRGWAGKASPAERAYQLAHADWAKAGASNPNLDRGRRFVRKGPAPVAPATNEMASNGSAAAAQVAKRSDASPFVALPAPAGNS
jgi:hypothetical protein